MTTIFLPEHEFSIRIEHRKYPGTLNRIDIMMKKTLFMAVIFFCAAGFAQETPGAGGASSRGMVDKNGKAYTKDHYKGVTPGIKDVADVPSKKKHGKIDNPRVEWVGFQAFRDYSRVFVQVLGTFTFTVTKTDQHKIEITIPSANIDTPNDARELVTFKFPTKVNLIKTREVKTDSGSSVVIDILLSKNVGYLFRQEGKYIFVDVENPH